MAGILRDQERDAGDAVLSIDDTNQFGIICLRFAEPSKSSVHGGLPVRDSLCSWRLPDGSNGP